jgi:leucyl aminopeptidase
MAWNTAARPGRPVGGEAMGMRALYAVIERRFASGRRRRR